MSYTHDDSQQDYGKKLISWNFKDQEEYTRTKKWYILFTSVFLILLIYAILTSNALFAVIVFLSGATFIFSSFQKSREVNFSIFEDGILIGKNFQPWKDLKTFWIVYDPPYSKFLYLTYQSIFKGEILIPVEDQNPVKIREILLDYLLEESDKDDENFVDILKRQIKL